MIVRKLTLLPEPDSPTTPRVSPGSIENETPSTALTNPSSVGKWTLRSLTSRSGNRLIDVVPHPRVQERVDDVHEEVRDTMKNAAKIVTPMIAGKSR